MLDTIDWITVEANGLKLSPIRTLKLLEKGRAYKLKTIITKISAIS